MTTRLMAAAVAAGCVVGAVVAAAYATLRELRGGW